MAMYHALFPPHLVQLVGQPQQPQHQHYVANGASPRQHMFIRCNRGAVHHEQHVQQKHSVDLLQAVGVDMSPANTLRYQHHNKGISRGRISSGPRSAVPPPFPLNHWVEGNYAKKNNWNKGNQSHQYDMNLSAADNSIPGKSQNGQCSSSSVESGERFAEERGSQCDGKGVKRQHEVYPKVSGAQGGVNSANNFGADQRPSLNEGEITGLECTGVNSGGGVAYQPAVPGNKRRFHLEGRAFAAFRNQRGRKMIPVGGLSTMLGYGLDPITKQSSGVLAVSDAPNRFLSRARLVHVEGPPPGLLRGGEWDKLSEGIWKKFYINQQSEETFRKKMLLWKDLHVLIKGDFPRYSLFVVGSTMSGFGSDSSDVDMCLLVRYSEMDQRSEAVGHLDHIMKYLKRCDFIETAKLIHAKVPILKFRDSRYGLEVDLNCNNSVGIRNTHLLNCYSQLDWRVKPLVLIVKLWAHKHNINDAKNMTISSYSLTLMVISYLQCGVQPAVLPCLHAKHPGKFSPYSDIHQIDLMEEMSPYQSKNTKSLGELFLGFLHYYAFRFDQEAVSVRVASRIPIVDCRRVLSYKNDRHQWKYLCIEEPFDLTNTARSVYDRDVFQRVKHVFLTSWQKLNDSKTIDCLFGD